MNSSRHMHDGFRNTILSEATFVFDRPEDLGRTNIVFDPDPVGGYRAVKLLMVFIKLAATRFFEGHEGIPVSLVTQITGVLYDIRLFRKEVEIIRDSLVMGLSAYGRTDEKYRSHEGGDYTVFKRVPLLFATVCISLMIIVLRSRYLPLCSIMYQYGEILIVQPSVKEGKILAGTCGSDAHLRQRLRENTVKGVYPHIAVALLHIEMVCHQLLRGVVFQIVQYEVKSVLHTGQRACLVYYGRTDSLSWFPSKLMVAEILVMRIPEIRKQEVKVPDIHTGQCPEHCPGISVLLIAHDNITDNTCVRVYAHIIKI